MVFASMPVCSAMRLAARPVGAASRIFVPLAARMRRMASSSVVLPTPGPPVTTATFDVRTIATAARCDGRQRLSGSRLDPRHGLRGVDRPATAARLAAKASSRSATPRSARCRPRRNTQAFPLDRVGDDFAVGEFRGQRALGSMRSSTSSSVDGQLDQFLHRQAAMAFVRRLLKAKEIARPHPLRRLPRHAELHGDGVGGAEADARGCRAPAGRDFPS